MSEQETLNSITEFVESIGIDIAWRTLPGDTFLPGLELAANCVIIDRDKLKYPGDILHEAGHLAVTTYEQRHAIGSKLLEEPFPTDGEEIGAVLWSYAAAKHIGLPLDVLFHPNGYKNQSEWLIERFESGDYVGLPLLQWMGLTFTPERAAEEDQPAFPVMQRWIR